MSSLLQGIYGQAFALMTLPWTVSWSIFVWWTNLLGQEVQLDPVWLLEYLEDPLFRLEKFFQGIQTRIENRVHAIDSALANADPHRLWVDTKETCTKSSIGQFSGNSKGDRLAERICVELLPPPSKPARPSDCLSPQEPAVQEPVQENTSGQWSINSDTFDNAELGGDLTTEKALTLSPDSPPYDFISDFDFMNDPDYPADVIADAQRWLEEHSDDEWEQDQGSMSLHQPRDGKDDDDQWESEPETAVRALSTPNSKRIDATADFWVSNGVVDSPFTEVMPGRGHYPVEVPLRILLGRHLIQQKFAP